jgi:hypothetical protein
MDDNVIRLRECAKLIYGDPKGFLEALVLLEAEVSVSDLPSKVKHLRIHSLKSAMPSATLHLHTRRPVLDTGLGYSFR